MNRFSKWTLFAAYVCLGMGGRAQEQSAEKWKPEVGVELTSELQVTTLSAPSLIGEGGERALGLGVGDYNYVNLLRLNAALPIVSPKSESAETTGLSFEIASLSTCMTAEESIGDDLQTFSNLDAGNVPIALRVCNLALTINGYHSLYLGIRNMNEDYFCSDVASLFTNSSCGIFPTIGANYDIANYPMASVGAHYRYGLTPSSSQGGRGEGVALQVSLYNGRGYSRFTGRENVFRFCPKDDGLFGLAEATYSRRGSSCFVGTAVYWGGQSLYNIKGVETDGRGLSFTPWAYAEQRVTDRLSLIAGYSHAFGRDAACRDFAGLGGRYAWERAELGLFTDYARFAEGDEFATEITCKVALTSHLFLQPSVHLIAMPGTPHSFQGAGTLRFGVVF